MCVCVFIPCVCGHLLCVYVCVFVVSAGSATCVCLLFILFYLWSVCLLCVYFSRLCSMAVAYVGRACLLSMAFLRYWIPPQRSQISSNWRGRISAPRFRVKPVSSKLNSHISISSLPANTKFSYSKLHTNTETLTTHSSYSLTVWM